MVTLKNEFQTQTCQQHLLLFTSDAPVATPKRIMLLHGAGVGGELTWTFVANYLTYWDEIYIPDLAGMGKAFFLDNPQPSVADYAQQLDELCEYLNVSISDFDFAGYSFGGMVLEHWLRDKNHQGLVFLLEPAMLFSENCQQILEKSQHYKEVSQSILEYPYDLGAYTNFLNSVSPKRVADKKADALTIKRLQENPQGFSQALAAITSKLKEECDYYINWQSPWHGASFVGGLSWPAMHQRHQQLAQQSQAWHFEVVPNTDHSLVFTRPRSIAKVMNVVAERYYS